MTATLQDLLDLVQDTTNHKYEFLIEDDFNTVERIITLANGYYVVGYAGIKTHETEERCFRVEVAKTKAHQDAADKLSVIEDFLEYCISGTQYERDSLYE